MTHDQLASELLPCPFCGGDPRASQHAPGELKVWVFCLQCGAQIERCWNPNVPGEAELRAANQWNTRTPPPSTVHNDDKGITPVPTLDGWQPIETAPKDGTWILVTGGSTNDESENRIVSAQFTNYLNGTTYPEGWWQFAWYDGGYYGGYADPTHWMSLPSPPSTTGASDV